MAAINICGYHFRCPFTTRRVSFPENMMLTPWVVVLHTLQHNSVVL